MIAPKLVEHFFRHEYGRLVAVLSNRVGVQHLQAVEDAVQSALMTALTVWTTTEVPDNPSAWLHRVATNNLLGELRQRTGHELILQQFTQDVGGSADGAPECLLPGEIQDDLLQMLFVCCDDAIPIESQLVLALKTLCGFSVHEIAHRLFITEANVYKRLGRARSQLREIGQRPNEFDPSQYAARRPAVHQILYLLFTEGYLSSHAELPIRRELCDEAIRLASILAEHPVGKLPETFALLALMHLHLARLSARRDSAGGLLLLEEQNRTLFDQQHIQVGLECLAESAQGEQFTRYHAEAGIAAEHCLAPSFDQTRWDEIAECYKLLEQSERSAIHRLNRAVAVAEWQGPAAGLTLLEGFAAPNGLTHSYLWAAVMADLHRRCGHAGAATRYKHAALKNAPSPAVRTALKRRLSSAS